MSITSQLHALGHAAHQATRFLASATTEQKNKALLAISEQIRVEEALLLEANKKDLLSAHEKELSPALLDRLTLTPERIQAIRDGIQAAAALPDPIGTILSEWTRPDHLAFQKISVPLGVIGIIYESRPNVTVDAAVLCLKAGNACLLRGGSEAFHSNMALTAALQRGLEKAAFPAACIQFVPFTDREAIQVLCEMDQYLHCLIPRGGKGLIETVVKHARMPVIKHYDGICTAYVDQDADLSMASELIFNAKHQRPSACNALETILVHDTITVSFLATAGKKLLQEGVTLRCSAELFSLFPNELQKEFSQQIILATPEDFHTEFLSLTLALKTVSSLEEAIEHIDKHSSHHSDLIITENKEHAEQFLREVDSAVVYWNASTRFTDGGEFGFGAEIGISTDKLHARGPMGLAELTSYKYLLRGQGQIRA